MVKRMRVDIDMTSKNKLRVAAYDPQNPTELYLQAITTESFEKLCNHQNLVIDKFSLLPGHMIKLFDKCIDEEYICALKPEKDKVLQMSIY